MLKQPWWKYSTDTTLNAYISPVMKHIGPFFTYDDARERRVDEINSELAASLIGVAPMCPARAALHFTDAC